MNHSISFIMIVIVILLSACTPVAPPSSATATAVGQTAAWKKIVGKYVTFECPQSWNPTPAPLFGGAILEDWRLGIPDGGPDQGLGFSEVSLREIPRPTDIILEKAITIGGKPGFKWIRSGPNYVHYDYLTTGYRDQSSFSVSVGVRQKDDILEAQLDRLVQSIVFNK